MGRFPYWKRIQKLDPTHINQQEQAWRNRENKQIYSVFANLLDTHKLWVSVDRYGVMRPTRYRKVYMSVRAFSFSIFVENGLLKAKL